MQARWSRHGRVRREDFVEARDGGRCAACLGIWSSVGEAFAGALSSRGLLLDERYAFRVLDGAHMLVEEVVLEYACYIFDPAMYGSVTRLTIPHWLLFFRDWQIMDYKYIVTWGISVVIGPAGAFYISGLRCLERRSWQRVLRGVPAGQRISQLGQRRVVLRGPLRWRHGRHGG